MQNITNTPWERRSQHFDIITINRVVWSLQHTGLRGSIDPLLEEADIDKDGKISLSEFRRLLRTASMSSRNMPGPSGVQNSHKV